MTGLRRALFAIGGIGALVLIGQVILISEAEFVDDQGIWIALDVVIGAGFVGVGLFAWDRRPDNRIGGLMVATAFAWFLAVYGNTQPALLFTVGNLFSNLFVATAIHLLLAFPTGRLESNFDRWLVRTAYVITGLGFVPVMLFFDPVAAGIANAPNNLLVISHHPGFVDDWMRGLDVVGVLILSVVVVRLIGRWRAATPPMRRVISPVFLAGGLLMAMLGALLLTGLFHLSKQIESNGYYIALIPFSLVPYLFLASLVRARMLRGGAVGELVAAIGGDVRAEQLRDALARALNDPSLDLAYWLGEEEGYVDARGRPVELPAGRSPRAAFDVRLDGRLVATLIHDPLLLDDPELIDAVGAAAALALAREHLEAELRAKVEQLRESRSRLLQVGLAERRRLERNLHDGAQQRLVSLALDLRLARAAIDDQEPDRAKELLDGAGAELDQALEELRELARGIHPAVLSDRGIDSAIEALAGRTPLPVEIDHKLGQRVSEPVELAAYFVVSEALTNVVKYASASRASIRLERENGSVRVEVADDGIGGADASRGSGLRGLADRISVLGGKLEVASPPGEGTKVIARLPCE
ncbi:MAG: sensor histidine kinase [Solirubrobacterales bacterium]